MTNLFISKCAKTAKHPMCRGDKPERTIGSRLLAMKLIPLSTNTCAVTLIVICTLIVKREKIFQYSLNKNYLSILARDIK